MMTLYIAAIGVVALLALIVSVVWFRRLTAMVIPVLFGVLFWATLNVVSYVGYAVDARYLTGNEAVVLQEIPGDDWIYLLVKLENDSEPRLVKMANTPSNKKKADEAGQQAKDGLTVIRFGGPPATGGGDGQDRPEKQDFEIVNLEDSSAYGKVAETAEATP